MSKTRRILQKDARHCSMEIILSLGVLVLWTLLTPTGWATGPQVRFDHLRTVRELMPGMLALSWWLLIVRVVQDESLVGESQSWLTRPLGWVNILAAKLLFILSFVALPFFLARLFLLHLAEMSILPNISTSVRPALVVAICIWLPVMALAATTANVVRAFFATVGIALYLTLVAYLDSFGPRTMTYGVGDSLVAPFICGTLLFTLAILVQYWKRRALWSRTILIVMLLLLTIYSIVQERSWSIHRHYPDLAANESPIFDLALNLDRSILAPPPTGPPPPPQPAYVTGPVTREDQAIAAAIAAIKAKELNSAYSGEISLPLTIDHIPDNHLVILEGGSFSYYDSVDQKTVEDPLNGDVNLIPGRQQRSITFYVPWEKFKAIADKPLSIAITVVVTEMESLEPEFANISDNDFPLPQGGICHPGIVPSWLHENQDGEPEAWKHPMRFCQYPVGRLSHTFVESRWSDTPCDAPSSGPEATAWIGPIDSTYSDDHSAQWNPVQDVQFDFNNNSWMKDGKVRDRFMCPGTPVKFTRYRVLRHRVLHFTLPAILPRDYTGHQPGNLQGYNGRMMM